MFRFVYQRFQRATFFEKLLLVVGLAIGVIGFWLINTVYLKEPTLSWSFIISIFLWFILIFIIILTDSNESIKEELSVIMREHIKETKLVKKEISLLNQDLSAMKRSKKK